MFSNWRWPVVFLAVAYLATGALFIAAAMQVAPPGPVRNAVLFCGAGLLVFFMASRLVYESRSGPREGLTSAPFALVICWGGGAACIITGLTQVTPAGPARQFVLYVSSGVALALLGWRFFTPPRLP